MYSTSRELKQTAKSRLKERVAPILLTAAVFIVADYVIGYLSNELSGYNSYSKQLSDIISSYAGELQTVTDPNALQALIERITAAVPTFYEFVLGRGFMGPLLSVLVSLMAAPLSVGYSHHILSESRGQETGLGYLMHGFKMTFKIIAIHLLISILSGLASLLFIIPGIILQIRYSMAYFVLLDNPELGPIECMRASGRIMSGNKGRYFWLEMSFLLWLIASSLVTTLIGVPILDLYVIPYMRLTAAGFYNEIVGYRRDFSEQTEL